MHANYVILKLYMCSIAAASHTHPLQTPYTINSLSSNHIPSMHENSEKLKTQVIACGVIATSPFAPSPAARPGSAVKESRNIVETEQGEARLAFFRNICEAAGYICVITIVILFYYA
jgi:hypothetical protein